MDTAHLFEGFLLAKEADGVRDTTLETYRVAFHSLAKYVPQQAEDITLQHLQRWAISLKGYARATRDQRIAKVKTFFTWCHTEGFLDINLGVNLKRPKKNWQPDPLTEEEITALLAESKKGRMASRNHAIVCTLLDSGMRNSELCNLTPEDLSKGQIRITEGKGAKGRVVLIGKRAKQALWRWMMDRPTNSTYLFVTENGDQISRIRLRVIVATIGKRAGIRAYPHRLRHTFALQYLKLGGDAYSLQYLLGHEDMTTVREYVKIAAQDVTQMYRSPLDALS